MLKSNHTHIFFYAKLIYANLINKHYKQLEEKLSTRMQTNFALLHNKLFTGQNALKNTLNTINLVPSA